MCTDKNNDNNKTNLPLFPSTVFLVAEKLPSLLRHLNFQTFNLFLLTLCEILSVIA